MCVCVFFFICVCVRIQRDPLYISAGACVRVCVILCLLFEQAPVCIRTVCVCFTCTSYPLADNCLCWAVYSGVFTYEYIKCQGMQMK